MLVHATVLRRVVLVSIAVTEFTECKYLQFSYPVFKNSVATTVDWQCPGLSGLTSRATCLWHEVVKGFSGGSKTLCRKLIVLFYIFITVFNRPRPNPSQMRLVLLHSSCGLFSVIRALEIIISITFKKCTGSS
jgi:hypothetical protein